MANKLPSIGKVDSIDSAGRSRATEQVGQVGKATEAAPVAAVAKAEKAAAAESASAVAATTAAPAVASTAAADAIADIAARLRSGTLTASQAVEALIQDAVAKNLPGVAPGSKLAEQLRSLLAAYADADPYLAARIKGLGTKE